MVGIDIGAGSTKCVILGADLKIRAYRIRKTSPDFDATARDVLGDEAVDYVATTGLGRYSVPWRQIQITDITCTARAAHHVAPEAPFVLDIGAQSTRAIRKDAKGRVIEFRCNEKCAAGSGGFLERAAKYLEMTVERLGAISMESTTPQTISSVCAVLAESEIINHVSEGRPVADIVRGIHLSLAERALMLLKRVGLNGPVVLAGGVALQAGMVQACKEKFGVEVIVPPQPQLMAALGAALLGWRRWQVMRAAR